MTNTAYDKIELHELIEFMLSNGTSLYGEVVGKDANWVTICTSDSNEPWSIAKSAIFAFRVHLD